MAGDHPSPLLWAVPEPGADAHADSYPGRGGQRNFRLIEGRTFARRFIRFLGSTLLVTLIVGLVGALVLHATIIQNQRVLDQQRTQAQRIAAETETLRSELAELEAPARIVRDALALGMIEPPSLQYIIAPGGALDERTLVIASNQLQVNE